MHAKGYFFAHPSREHYVIGSSNWTDKALSENQELNVWYAAFQGSAFQVEVETAFDAAFARASPVTRAYVEAYRQVWKRPVGQTIPINIVADVATPSWTTAVSDSHLALPRPNAMQAEGLTALQKLVDDGEEKALVISATGTGKTYLSAFFVRNLKARRVLFVVHRERIAQQAMESFRDVLGIGKSYGLYIGAQSDTQSDFIFSTVQTLSRSDRLNRFGREDFDCIIVDESHRAGAKSYERFLSHFRPKFLLGMTATPERTDGLDIFPLFDHNVAFEIRLQRALREDMLCPFHYFGVSDLTVNNEIVEDLTDFNKLTDSVRIDHIVDKIRRYGCCSDRVRGLMFCSRNEEAARLSDLLNQRGLRTIALSGKDDETVREAAIARLEAPEGDVGGLDYILTVDIFNEGVDIPSVNQVVMLRPTNSAIVFVQQLGRGLRKVHGEDKYLTVIDFIGNYDRNFLIPAALFGDTTWNKDKLRRLLISGNDTLPGSSTVNFDVVTKDRIFRSIDRAKNTVMRDLKAEYAAMAGRLGRPPRMMDWKRLGGRDARLFGAAAKGAYVHFARLVGDDDAQAIEQGVLGAMAVWAKDALNGSSIEEPTLVLELLNHRRVPWDSVSKRLRELGFPTTQSRLLGAARSINLQFLRTNKNKQLVPFAEILGNHWLEWDENHIWLGPLWPDDDAWVCDMAEFAESVFMEENSPATWRDGFAIGSKYTRSDVFRILGYPVNPVAQNVGGYLVDESTDTCPIFVTYHKSEDISETTQYEDHFKNPSTLHYFSKSNRTLASADMKYFLQVAQGGSGRMPLFVKKNDDEGIDFYFLGDVKPIIASFREDRMQTKDGKPGAKVVRA
jgi:superfamily II DNA or RNA helicase